MKFNWKQIAVVVAGGALVATSFAFAQSTTTTSNPLTVSCSGNVSANVITWTATATGGIAPYSFAWSGDGVSGATSTSVTATYLSNGTRTVSVTATDSATTTANTATSSCSATVSSIVPNPTSTPNPLPRANKPSLSINPNGEFHGRGMTVTSVGSSSFQAQVWGITYTVDWSGNLQGVEFLLRRGDNSTSTPAAQLAVGDEVGVSGRIDPSSPLVVNADVVRDYSIVFVRSKGGDENGNGGDDENGGHGRPVGPPIEVNLNGSTSASGSIDFMGRLNDLFKQFQNLQNLFHGNGSGHGDNGNGGGNGQGDH